MICINDTYHPECGQAKPVPSRVRWLGFVRGLLAERLLGVFFPAGLRYLGQAAHDARAALAISPESRRPNARAPLDRVNRGLGVPSISMTADTVYGYSFSQIPQRSVKTLAPTCSSPSEISPRSSCSSLVIKAGRAMGWLQQRQSTPRYRSMLLSLINLSSRKIPEAEPRTPVTPYYSFDICVSTGHSLSCGNAVDIFQERLFSAHLDIYSPVCDRLRLSPWT